MKNKIKKSEQNVPGNSQLQKSKIAFQQTSVEENFITMFSWCSEGFTTGYHIVKLALVKSKKFGFDLIRIANVCKKLHS